jgi:hypothetical protein
MNVKARIERAERQLGLEGEAGPVHRHSQCDIARG